MPVLITPDFVVARVERSAPGVFRQFVGRFGDAAIGIPEGQVESWFRDSVRNAQVGGLVDSQHLLGLGVDTSHSMRASSQALAARLRARGFVVVEGRSAGTGRFLLHAQAWPAGTARRAGLFG